MYTNIALHQYIKRYVYIKRKIIKNNVVVDNFLISHIMRAYSY